MHKTNIIHLSEKLCQTTPPHELPNILAVEEIIGAMPSFPKYLHKYAVARNVDKTNARRTFDEYEYKTPYSPYTITFYYHAMGILITKVVKT